MALFFVTSSLAALGAQEKLSTIMVLLMKFRMLNMRRTSRLIVACFASVLAAVPTVAADRPNILFIMTDDHAAHAIGAYGSRVNRTPNLDRLAREGAMLRNVFATNSICTPSRAAILTGQYSHVSGVTVFNRFDSTRMTVPAC